MSSGEIHTRLATVAGQSTLRLTHYGRRTGKPYEVTIWFMVEGETVYLVTANRRRQWPRNVLARPTVMLRIGNETFAGRVAPLDDPTANEHAVDLMATKYWYTRPYVWLGRRLGWELSSAAFRVDLMDQRSAAS